MSAANDELFFAVREAMHRKEVDTVPGDDLLLVYFAEQLFANQPDSRTVAERALLHTHGRFL
jgi:hypothetical protein